MYAPFAHCICVSKNSKKITNQKKFIILKMVSQKPQELYYGYE